jgi:ParB family transcriptional regulator, chromosome partitioning protein
MTRRSGLGRGLDALIPGDDQPPADGIVEIAVDNIERNPRQPRSQFDADELEELATSIREFGVIQPIIVTIDPDQPDRFILVAGERRLLACRKAGLETVPALVRELTDQGRLEMALIENVQRSDLNPLEAANAFHQLVEDFHLSHEEIAARVGKSRAAITNTLRLLNLVPNVQRALIEAKISEGHARALLGLPIPQAQSMALLTILSHDLNVRQTEELVRRLSGERTEISPKPAALPEIVAIQNRLMETLGTRVELNHRRKGGTIVIHYYSDEELNSLLDQLLRQD